jgi:hypothetical protein
MRLCTDALSMIIKATWHLAAQLSLANHDGRANAVHVSHGRSHFLRALRPIAAGDELTIVQIPLHMPQVCAAVERDKELRQDFVN